MALTMLGSRHFLNPFFLCSTLIYGAPAWLTLMCKQSKDKLESIQRHANRVSFPHLTYAERLTELRMQTLHDFIFSICVKESMVILAILFLNAYLSTTPRDPLGLEILALPISVQQYVEPRNAQIVFFYFYAIF